MVIVSRIRRFFSQARPSPTPLERTLRMSIDPKQYNRFSGKSVSGPLRNIRGGGVQPARTIYNIVPTTVSGTPGGGAVQTVFKGLGSIGKFLAPSLNPKIVGTRALATYAAETAYKSAYATQKGSKEFTDYIPSAKGIAYALSSGVFPPFALAGVLGSKSTSEFNSLVDKSQQFFTSFKGPKLPTPTSELNSLVPPGLNLSISSPAFPEFAPTSGISPTYAPSVSVTGSGGGDLGLLQSILIGGLAGLGGFALGRKKRKKRKKYKRGKRKK